jgi:sialate O-acetylesterase
LITVADVKLPGVFGDHMVVQRDTPFSIWGTADPGEKVSVTVAGKGSAVVADANGKWKAISAPLPAPGPVEIEVRGKNMIFLKDVLVGEVWIASGQSNMDFTMARTEKYYFAGVANADAEIAAANHPQLRMFTADWTMASEPESSVSGYWRVCSPAMVGEFSAVAYFFARELQQVLNVPVGIITCTYGASTVQAWTSREALEARPKLKPLLEKFDGVVAAYRGDPARAAKFAADEKKWDTAAADAKAKGVKVPRKPKNPDPVQDQHNPTVLFNGMIAPIIPYTIRGAIWYQGESNTSDASLYATMQATLIEDWRQRWGIGDFPFYLVQIANYKDVKPDPGESRMASFREAQARALELKHTGMTVTIDIGEASDVHPRNKLDVGKRLSRIALAQTYDKRVEFSGPVLDSMEMEGGHVRLKFLHATGGLVAKGGPLKQFAIAGIDRKYVWADAMIDGATVIVSHPSVPEPKSVRYAWADNPDGCNLYNGEGLPAAPFRAGE